ncbi:MAG: hypothetical protein LCI00_32975 [Chloroflexi bacterium]|nr:hypothetical protein [Chloroflexota bacterium]MCC6895497.1 hypothetical protein [Anaerolineae bacterium]
MTSKRTLYGIAITTVLLFIMAVIPFAFPNFASTCLLPKVSAQDNPCLAQESTLAVLQLQSTLAAVNFQGTAAAYEATITALQTHDSDTATAPPPAGLPFTDPFDDNRNNWDTFPTANGNLATIQDGRMTVKVDEGNNYWLPVPNLSVSDDFYIEANVTITPDCWNWLGVGFGLGSADQNQYAAFMSVSNGGVPRAAYWDQPGNTEQFPIAYDRGAFWPDIGGTFPISLESRNGVYTLYFNGREVWKQRSDALGTRYGNNLGFMLLSYSTLSRRPCSVSYDDLVVRDQR